MNKSAILAFMSIIRVILGSKSFIKLKMGMMRLENMFTTHEELKVIPYNMNMIRLYIPHFSMEAGMN